MQINQIMYTGDPAENSQLSTKISPKTIFTKGLFKAIFYLEGTKVRTITTFSAFL